MFVCNGCKAAALKITKVLELQPEDDHDEQSLQIVACDHCAATYVAVYEESRRGALDSEASHHVAWRVPAQTARDVELAIDACPTPRDDRCPCETHRSFNHGGFRAQLSGRTFAMRWE